MSKLHIIIPCKNDFGFAKQTLNSILEQSFKDWKCTIIFDHSPQEVIDRISRFTANYPQFTLLENSGVGIVDALNTGMANIKIDAPQYITRFDIDDIMPPDRLSLMIETLENNPTIDLVTGNVKYFSNNSISEGYQKYEYWINNVNQNKKWFESIYRECTIASPNWIMRFEKFNEIGSFKALKYPEDYDLVFRWYQNSIKIHGINKTTLFWNEHQNRTSRNSEHYKQKAFFKLKIDRWLDLDFTPDLSVLLVGHNKKAHLTAQILIEKDIDFKWFVKNVDRLQETPFNQSIFDIKNINQHLPAQALIAFYEDGEHFEKELQYTFGNNRYFVL